MGADVSCLSFPAHRLSGYTVISTQFGEDSIRSNEMKLK